MLLRLLPAPSASHPSPPTILFTLALPSHPYTSKSLPLPPNLLAHRSVCLQEDIECPNVLLGEKSTWIAAVIQEATFSMPLGSCQVSLTDGSTLQVPLPDECLAYLKGVCKEVELSFAPLAPAAPVASVQRSPSNASVRSTASNASASSASSSASASASTSSSSSATSPSARRSPSSIFYSLISPLLSSPTLSSARPAQPINPARAHRRAARSLLVDTFRRFILPSLKGSLPSAYLPWAIRSESATRRQDFDCLRSELDTLSDLIGVPRPICTSPRRSSKKAASSDSWASSSDESDDSSDDLEALSYHTYLDSVMPLHKVPAQHRAQYSSLVDRMMAIRARLTGIDRLSRRYKREESKRYWLENLERGRMGEKAVRRAFSNGLLQDIAPATASQPAKTSRLRQSYSAADLARDVLAAAQAPVHPAMVAEEDEEDHDDTSSESSDEPVTPRESRLLGTDDIVRIKSQLDDAADADADADAMEVDSVPALVGKLPSTPARPPLPPRRIAALPTVAVPPLSPDNSDTSDDDSDEELPDLVDGSIFSKESLPSSASSDTSDASGEWENASDKSAGEIRYVETASAAGSATSSSTFAQDAVKALATLSNRWIAASPPALPPKPKMRVVNWARQIEA